MKTREAVLVWVPSNLPESTSGEAWGCKDSREGGFQVLVVLASTVLRGNQKQWSARWGHLNRLLEGAFFASFLCRRWTKK
jgi:hypothetical protein